MSHLTSRKRSPIILSTGCRSWPSFPLLALGAILGLTLLFSLTSSAQKSSHYWSAQSAKAVQIPGASRVGTDACAACHSEVAANFRHAFHAAQGIECEDCHGPASLHVEGGGDITKIVSFGRRSEREANAVCLSCHQQSEQLRNWMAGPHSRNRVRCTDCHQSHVKALRAVAERRMNFDTMAPGGRLSAIEQVVPESKAKFETRAQANDACLKCHASQRGQMNLPFHHPLREGKVSCQDCHDPHGGPAGNNLRTAAVNPLCLNCHAQYQGPFTYQHPPVTESCLNCHSPHGSVNSNLLSVSMPALCLQCHAGHHNGAGLPLADRCTNCHGSIHGTDVPSATGGTVFIDKGSFGLPNGAAPARTFNRARSHPLPVHGTAAFGGALGAMFGGPHLPMLDESGAQTAGPTSEENYGAVSATGGGYRFTHVSGYGGRVGEYDSLQQSGGSDVQAAYVSLAHELTLLSRANIQTGEDYQIGSRLTLGERLAAGFDIRSFIQHQDTYPFYANQFSPDDIFPDQFIPSGAVFGVKRRLGSADARVKVPKLPVHLFVRGHWQARVGTTQLAWYDMGGDAGCNFCHFTSQFQGVNYTTRHVGGGADVNVGKAVLTWEHEFSSFNDRLGFPSGVFGATFGEELPPGVPSTLPGTYFLDVPAPNQSSADTLRANWSILPELLFNGHVTYSRARNLFTRNPQNFFDAYTTLHWHPFERLRLLAHYGQDSQVNDFTPSFYPLFGNVSYHRHTAGLRADYDLTRRFDLEAYYRRAGISRSNASLWPQFYSPNNTDVLLVVPVSFSNTLGLASRFHGGNLWSVRAGYEWTGTHDPGYLTVPKSNSRILAVVTLSPIRWLVFTNDTSVILQNAFPLVARRNRFYVNTSNATFLINPDWNLELGYSYQQNKLATFMAIQNDPGANYVLQEPFVPYNQLSQTYWAQVSSRFLERRLGLEARVAYNSARSGMLPDLNPNDAALLGNASLIQQGVCGPTVPPPCFDPVAFQLSLGALRVGATQVSQVVVPEWIGQSKLYYRLPRGFDGGLLFYYGSYRDQLNPGLNGVLRTFTVYIRRTW